MPTGLAGCAQAFTAIKGRGAFAHILLSFSLQTWAGRPCSQGSPSGGAKFWGNGPLVERAARAFKSCTGEPPVLPGEGDSWRCGFQPHLSARTSGRWGRAKAGADGGNLLATAPLGGKQGLLKRDLGNKMRLNTSLLDSCPGWGSGPESDG